MPQQLKSTVTRKFDKVRDIVPKELSTKTKRKAHITAVITTPGTLEERRQRAIAITRRVKQDVIVWTTRLDRAAYYLSEDRMSLKQIAIKTGVPSGRLRRLIALDGEFKKRVDHYSEMWIKKVTTMGIANRAVRCSVLQEMHDKMLTIVRDRADKYSNRAAPGVKTGLMVRTVKAVGHGGKTKIVRGWDLDKDLLKELRETQKQLAQDLGQWTEKVDTQNLVLVREYKGADTDQV